MSCWHTYNLIAYLPQSSWVHCPWEVIFLKELKDTFFIDEIKIQCFMSSQGTLMNQCKRMTLSSQIRCENSTPFSILHFNFLYSPLSARMPATWSLYFEFSRKSIQCIRGFTQSQTSGWGASCLLASGRIGVCEASGRVLSHRSSRAASKTPNLSLLASSEPKALPLLCPTWTPLPLSRHAGVPSCYLAV